MGTGGVSTGGRQGTYRVAERETAGRYELRRSAFSGDGLRDCYRGDRRGGLRPPAGALCAGPSGGRQSAAEMAGATGLGSADAETNACKRTDAVLGSRKRQPKAAIKPAIIF